MREQQQQQQPPTQHQSQPQQQLPFMSEGVRFLREQQPQQQSQQQQDQQQPTPALPFVSEGANQGNGIAESQTAAAAAAKKNRFQVHPDGAEKYRQAMAAMSGPIPGAAVSSPEQQLVVEHVMRPRQSAGVEQPNNHKLQTTTTPTTPNTRSNTILTTQVKPLKVLSLGGDQTLGQGMDHPATQTYVAQLFGSASSSSSQAQVDSIALADTGASYPSLCLESMLKHQNLQNTNYDLILLDYTTHQSDGLRFLLRRLRQRYPDAALVFVHIYSLVDHIFEVTSGRAPLDYGLDSEDAEWDWKTSSDDHNYWKRPSSTVDRRSKCVREICYEDQLLRLVEANARGHVWFMPLTESPQQILQEQWFQEENWSMLTAKGHAVVAHHLGTFLEQHSIAKELQAPNKRLATFGEGGGDLCIDWFHNGPQVTKQIASPVTFRNARFNCPAPTSAHSSSITNPAASRRLDAAAAAAAPSTSRTSFSSSNTNEGCVFEMMPAPQTSTTRTVTKMAVNFHNPYSEPVPVAVSYRSQQFPMLYPNVVMELNNNTQMSSTESGAGSSSSNSLVVDPQYNQHSRKSDKGISSTHTISYVQVGWAQPGANTLQLTVPVVSAGNTHSSSVTAPKPFALAGLYLCPSCKAEPMMGSANMGMAATNLEMDRINASSNTGSNSSRTPE
jgi:CheY-like chemotaxis protein